MLDYSKRLIHLSEFLKTTSFFWEKELLNQDLTQLPAIFVKKAKEFEDLSLEDKAYWANHGQDQEISELTSFKVFNQSLPHKAQLFVKQKKAHEFSRILAYLKQDPPKQLVDICGGIGHLPMALMNLNSDLKSITLDYDPALIKKGIALNSKSHLRYQLTDLRKVKSLPESDWYLGLHTCGDLAEHAIHHFINSESHNLMNWGCCYHKTPSWNPLSELGKKHLPPFDKFALTLAAKCFKELDTEAIRRRYQVKKYRYALELFIGNQKNFKTGSFHPRAYQGSFTDYIEHANCELSLSIPKQAADQFYQNNIKKIKQHIALGFYRDHWGRAIESAIIVDRAMYLIEQGYNVEIIEMFDRKLSPRNLALTATRAK